MPELLQGGALGDRSAFRFSGGCAGPGESTIGRLIGQDGTPLLIGIQDRC
jgi:hypothetical protein